MSNGDKIKKALFKKATGYTATERTEEFGMVEGELALIKRRVKKTHVPPDVTAAKLMLLSENDIGAYENMSDEELKVEREKLIEALREEQNATDRTEV